jgi:hypothetical protein
VRPNAEIPISVELLRMILDLPPEYKIVGAFTPRGAWREEVRLLVETPDLPTVSRDGSRHVMQPVFRRVETGKAELLNINVWLNGDPNARSSKVGA